MTYAGLLSLIYADVHRDDPRVRSAFEWATAHWTLDENPGVGAEGKYYFMNVLTKALAAYGQSRIPVKGEAGLDWRAEVTICSRLIRRPATGTGQTMPGAGWKTTECWLRLMPSSRCKSPPGSRLLCGSLRARPASLSCYAAACRISSRAFP